MEKEKLQRPIVYNQFLPFYESDLHDDALKFLEELKTRLDLSNGLPSSELTNRFAVDLHKYIILYGFRFTRKEHEEFIRTLYGLFLSKYDPVTLENVSKILVYLLKKKYLLSKDRTLVLPWKPLFKMYYFWEHSNAASRNLIPCQSGFKNSILSVIKYSRSFFSQESTSEMLKEWRPFMNPNDCPMTTVMTFFNLFLPTSSDVGPPEKTYFLWLEEFFGFWSAYGNSPAWEIELFELLSRLAHHNLGRIDWTPWVKDIFTKIMNALNLPVTYGGSGLRFQFGLSDVNSAKSISSISRWITSTIGGGSPTMSYLKRLLCAIESYYYPANTNSASEILHSFISLLCSYFVDRIHIEKYNTKWESKTPLEKRVTNAEIDEFVLMLMPVAGHILFSDFENEKKQILNNLATLRPTYVLPMIINRFRQSVETLTEPQRFHACINALTAVTRPLVENYPLEIIPILTSLLPGIDVNDIWKCTDIFILMSDILEMIWVIDFSNSSKSIRSNDCENIGIDYLSPGSLKHSKNLSEMCLQSSVFEEFAINFVDKCLRLVENSSREETRSENDAMDDSYNDEEMVADAAITDTFQKIMSRCSSSIFDSAFNKLKKYVQNRILEPAVAGGILAGMCRSVVSIKPEKTLKFFIPHLKERIMSLVEDRSCDPRRQNKELQFVLLLFSEVVGFKVMSPNVVGPSYLVPHIEDICTVLDKTLILQQKDNYEIAANILETVIASFCQIRILKDVPANLPTPIPYSEKYEWGLPGDLDNLKIKWYLPGDKELEIVKNLVKRYLTPCINNLSKFSKGEKTMEKEEVLRNLRQMYKILQGSSEVTESFVQPDKKPTTVLPSIIPCFDKFNVYFEGRPIRQVVYEVCHAVKEYLFSVSSDDTVSLDTIVSIFDSILFSFGLNEDDLDDQFEEHRTLKEHKKNHLVRSKKHLESVLLDRIVIQFRTFIWLKNIIDTQRTPPQIINDLFELATYRYSEVRIFAQELLNRLLFRPTTEKIHEMILDRLIESIKADSSHEKLKGALHIILSQQFHFMYSWNSCSKIMPALITSHHSDKNSVIDLLKYISFNINRSFSDYSLFHIPTVLPKPNEEVYALMGLSKEHLLPLSEDVINEDFLKLELEMIDLIQNGNLHWRRYQMSIGMLLGFINHKHIPHEKSIKIWLDALIHEDLTIRLTAFQALEAILKVIKVKKARKSVQISNVGNYLKPGVREDNNWMQYKRFESEEDLKEYWDKPFCVKTNVGYYYWFDGETKLRTVDESVPEVDKNNIRASISEKFLNDEFINKLIDLNSIEHKKGEDFFSWDKAFFFTSLFESFNDAFVDIIFRKVSPLVESSEESHQRVAAEVVCGVVCGSRFWSYEKSKVLWEKYLIPMLDKLLNSHLTNETLNDWEVCFSAITNKVDQNRMTWLYEFMFEKHFVPGVKRALNESGILCLMNKVLKQNWKALDLHDRAYKILTRNLDHPYTKIRNDIAKVLATLTTKDAEYPGDWNSGKGFPTRVGFISHVLPYLNLNYRNPVINGGANHNTIDESSRGSEIDQDDPVDDDSELQRKTKSDHILETVSNWCQYYFQMTSVSIRKEMYELLPFFCQFIGVETDQELSQSCLKALCFLSVCIVPSEVVPHVLDMSNRIVQSDSYKAKLSLLEFIQVFVFTNFLSICTNADIVLRVENFIVKLMTDNNLQVRSKAAKILCGLLHSKFLGDEAFTKLLKLFRSKIRLCMTRDNRKSKFSKKKSLTPNLSTKEKLAEFHSGILGLCSFVEAYPYEVPEFVPDILIELETHLHDPTPVPKTIKKTLQEFKRTHQDNWDEHKLKFTDDQLLIMTELLVSPNYYA
uniref:Proteasome activator complex subunit 4 n=1 Tax=Lepeophtheirus salmonis TaxID=72036 RepID=A0A0K2T807_LEPSM